MTRRILDNVSITALDKHGDAEFTKEVCDSIGIGVLVADIGKDYLIFNKSMFGLKGVKLSSHILKLSKSFQHEEDICKIVDSQSQSHAISGKALSIIKALVFYKLTCPRICEITISNLFKEIDSYLIDGKVTQSVTNEVIDGIAFDNKHLMEYCRSEIYPLLKEAGVLIE